LNRGLRWRRWRELAHESAECVGEQHGEQHGLPSKQRPKENEDHLYPTHAPLPNTLPYIYADWDESSCGRGNIKCGSPRKGPKTRFLVRMGFPGGIGDVGGVVFPCGYTLDADGDTIRLYYGAAGTSITLASGSLRELLRWLKENSPHGDMGYAA